MDPSDDRASDPEEDEKSGDRGRMFPDLKLPDHECDIETAGGPCAALSLFGCGHSIGKDSIGGIVECHITGVMPGLGDPCFDKLDALLAHAILSIGACKGFEVGRGFESATLRGSVNNDPMMMKDGKECFETNNAGGILGGISNGNEIVFRAAFKPTPSIYKDQHTVDRAGNDVTIAIKGRHDPCIVPRAVVVVESMAAIVLADRLLVQRAYGR